MALCHLDHGQYSGADRLGQQLPSLNDRSQIGIETRVFCARCCACCCAASLDLT
jgi:hypothetical protein